MFIVVKLRWKVCVKDFNFECVFWVSVKLLGKFFFSLLSLAGGIFVYVIIVNLEFFLSIWIKDRLVIICIFVIWLCLLIIIGLS